MKNVCQHLPTCEQAISSKPEAFVDLPSTLLGYCCYTCTLHAYTVLLLKVMKWPSQGKYLGGNQDVIMIFIMLHTGGIDFGQISTNVTLELNSRANDTVCIDTPIYSDGILESSEETFTIEVFPLAEQSHFAFVPDERRFALVTIVDVNRKHFSYFQPVSRYETVA